MSNDISVALSTCNVDSNHADDDYDNYNTIDNADKRIRVFKTAQTSDATIIALFEQRSETAITELANKYSAFCRTVAHNLLRNAEDTDEVLNDTYNRVWNAIPPERPENLRAFVGKVVRNLSLNRLQSANRKKRGGGAVMIASELETCMLAQRNAIDDFVESNAISTALNEFLSQQTPQNRIVFMSRYWGAESINEISESLGISSGKVKSILFRMRNKLKIHLENEGVYL